MHALTHADSLRLPIGALGQDPPSHNLWKSDPRLAWAMHARGLGGMAASCSRASYVEVASSEELVGSARTLRSADCREMGVGCCGELGGIRK